MKKLKLKLKKEVISDLQSRSIRGGYVASDDTSAGGCTTNDYRTMTCPSWGCKFDRIN
jgi:hypothetical protein